MKQALKQAFVQWRLKARSSGLVIGKHSTISNCSFGRSVAIGRYSTLLDTTMADFSYVGEYARICRTTVGKFCSIASSIDIGTGSHPTRGFVSSHPIFYLARPRAGWNMCREDRRVEHRQTTLGNDVWISSGAIVRDGVSVGDGVIVGAGSVVTKDLSPYGIYGGVPAKLIRWRFEPEQIEFLLRFRWWDRPVDWLSTHCDCMHDIDDFMAQFGPANAWRDSPPR